MRSKWIIRIWLGRLTRYLVVPLVFCVILFPLYGLMHQQTEKAQLTDDMYPEFWTHKKLN